MLKEYSGALSIDKILKDKYNYIYDGNLENLYKQSFIEIEGNGVSALCWITLDEEKYLFKPFEDSPYNIWGELLSQEIARILEIPCADYRYATLGNKRGVLTKNILKKEETLILGCEIFQDFLNNYPYKESKKIIEDVLFTKLYKIPKDFASFDDYNAKRYLFNYLNNLEEIWAILSLKKDLTKENREEIINELEDMLLFDMITLQTDRHPNNWGIKKTNDGHHRTKLIDNSVILGFNSLDIENKINDFQNEVMLSKATNSYDKINSIIYSARPNFTLSEDNVIDYSTRLKDTSLKVLDDYLTKTSTKGIQKLEVFMSKLNIELLDEIIARIEQVNGLEMPTNLYSYIINIYEIHFNNINNIIEKHKKRSKENGERGIFNRV